MVVVIDSFFMYLSLPCRLSDKLVWMANVDSAQVKSLKKTKTNLEYYNTTCVHMSNKIGAKQDDARPHTTTDDSLFFY